MSINLPFSELDQQYVITNNFRIDLELDGSLGVDASFLDCQNFISTSDVIEICEVASGSQGRVMRTKIPGNNKYSNLILRRGSSRSHNFWKWFQSINNGGWSKERKNMTVLFGSENRGDYLFKLDLFNAWVKNYRVGDVDAGSANFQIEEIEIVFDYFERTSQKWLKTE